MKKTKPKLPSAASIRLNETLHLAQASDLAEQIMAARGSPLIIDASAVQHLGAQCAQILIAASVAWRSEAQAFTIVDQSACFVDNVRLLGLADHLQG